MNVILVPQNNSRGVNVSLSHRHVLVLVVVGLILLPALIGTVAFKIQGLLTRSSFDHDIALITAQKRELAAQRRTVLALKAHTSAHLNALAQRLGFLQAQVLRLNALGERLTRMARLDPREFDFSQNPGLGGPANSLTDSPPPLLTTINHLTAKINRQTHRLKALESVLMDKQLLAAVTPSGWPVTGGWLSSHFGWRADPFSGRRSLHQGVDIASPMGSPIKAMGTGVVTYAGPKRGYGRLVEINHGNGYATRYAHVSKVLVKVGDRVEKGSPVALVGTSGRSTGPHLHFEVRKHGRSINPAAYLNPKKRYSALR